MSQRNLLAKTKQKFNNKRIFAFDIETANNNKDFVLASIIGHDYKRVFYSKEEFTDEVESNYIFRNSIIFATNLSFDFFGIYFKRPNFFTLFRGGKLIMAKTWIYHNRFINKSTIGTNPLKSILFLDSLNYAQMGVKDMGKIIGKNKLKEPKCFKRMPENKEEWQELEAYNIRDSEITYDFMNFLIDVFESLGATVKYTIASTSMSLFKNKYLEKVYARLKEDDLIDIFKCYYGGRTEAFSRGEIKDYNYYDYNSMYASAMRDYEYPDPNYHRITHENSRRYIDAYEGCSDVDIYVFPCKYPILPVRRDDGRVIFPYGNIRGFYTHIEIRKALEAGAVLKRVHKTHYFLKNCRPFEAYVNDLYSLRKKYKKENNKLELCIKLLLTNLYGKFGQKFKGKENWIHESMFDIDKIDINTQVEYVDGYYKITQDVKPSSFCIPIWAAYVTAYGRLKLYDAIIKYNPVYVDTDSIITKCDVKESEELGEFKLEMKIKKGYIVRPKFYAVMNDKDVEHIKVKGLGKRISFARFMGLFDDSKVFYDKFTTVKEALRRNLIPNEMLETHKDLSLEDEKRVWGHKFFDCDMLQDSFPLDNDVLEALKQAKLNEKSKKLSPNYYKDLIATDKFDWESVGKDITFEDFIRNEMRGEFDE